MVTHKASLTVRLTSPAGTKVGSSERALRRGIKSISTDKRYARDNRLIFRKSSYRPESLAGT
jgi:hypothetical protein